MVARRLDSLAVRYLRRPVTHLTPRYVCNRTKLALYASMHPSDPWLTSSAVSLLSQLLKSTDVGLEYGSGRSTVWFASRTQFLTSVEHSGEWVGRVAESLQERLLQNVMQIHVRVDAESNELTEQRYVVGRGLADESLGYVLIDGLYRQACALNATALLQPGGLLILDNSNRHIATETPAPYSTRTTEGGWRDFLATVAGWRKIWTTNGVYDTTIWIKP